MSMVLSRHHRLPQNGSIEEIERAGSNSTPLALVKEFLPHELLFVGKNKVFGIINLMRCQYAERRNQISLYSVL